MINTGITHTVSLTVTDSLSARSMGSGSLDVLATPAMIAGMENVCMNCIQPHLESGFTTVGTKVDISHISATPVGDTVTFTCVLTEIDRKRLVFSVEAFDSEGKIGEGTHHRFIVDSAKFTEKTYSKKK